MHSKTNPPPVSAVRHRRAESLAGRTLMAVARQRKGLDAARCQLVLEHLDTAMALQLALHRALAGHRLSDLQFGVLVALFALDPESATPADLADYSAVSRAAVSDALMRLESLALIVRTRDSEDRRVHHVQLTAQGRATVDHALMVYLRVAGDAARHIARVDHEGLLLAYRRLLQGASESVP